MAGAVQFEDARDLLGVKPPLLIWISRRFRCLDTVRRLIWKLVSELVNAGTAEVAVH
jgi:hypothetical protein